MHGKRSVRWAHLFANSNKCTWNHDILCTINKSISGQPWVPSWELVTLACVAGWCRVGALLHHLVSLLTDGLEPLVLKEERQEETAGWEDGKMSCRDSSCIQKILVCGRWIHQSCCCSSHRLLSSSCDHGAVLAHRGFLNFHSQIKRASYV